jgi:CubicO group peptidase (beta-lactamase class C family)
VPASKKDRITDCYAYHPRDKMKLFDKGDESRWMIENRLQSGGGGLASTLGDYHRFCRMLVNGGALDGAQILSPKTLELMTANHLPGGKDLTEHVEILVQRSGECRRGLRPWLCLHDRRPPLRWSPALWAISTGAACFQQPS